MKYFPSLVALLAFVMLITLPVPARAGESRAKVYSIQGRYVGTILTERAPRGLEWRPVRSLPVQTPLGAEAVLASGVYMVAPIDFVPPWGGGAHEAGFSFLDVSADRLPQKDLEAGDIQVADMNGDGRPDILICLYSPICDSRRDMRPNVWIQMQNGKFQDQTQIRIPAVYGAARRMQVFDADGDGDLDIFLTGSGCIGDPYPQATLLVNDGKGNFTDESSTRLPKIPGESFLWSGAAGLLDNDRSEDLAVVAWNTASTDTTEFPIRPLLWMNDGSGVFHLDTTGRLPKRLRYGFGDLFVSDLTSDSLNDILSSNQSFYITGPGGPEPVDSLSGQTALLRNTGNGYFLDETPLRIPPGFHRSTRTLALGDVDNDGHTDILELGLLWAADTPQVRLLHNDGAGFFTFVRDSVLDTLSGWFNDGKFGRLNSDPYTDLFLVKVMPGENAYDKLLINIGGSRFRDSSQLLPPRMDFSVAAALFDYQADGDLDIAIANSDPWTPYGGQAALYQNMLYDIPFGVGGDPLAPAIFRLHQNFPNPFNPSTTIRYSLQRGGNVSLSVYTSLGQPVRMLVSGFQGPGEHSVDWSPRGLASGVYFYRLVLDGEVLDQKAAVYVR